MSVVIETTQGDITVDLYLYERPLACTNFLKLCKMKYYNFNLFHTISRGFIAQTGDPTGTRSGGDSIYGLLEGPAKRYFKRETEPRIGHTRAGLISFVGNDEQMLASQFFLTLGDDLRYLDAKHCVFGEIVEGFEILELINEAICDNDDRPFQDIRITHTVVIADPLPDPINLVAPSRSPSASPSRLAGGRIAPDEEIDETGGKTAQEVSELQADREARARATILEMVGDIPDADIAPPENVLFVCKLNPVTSDDDLEIIFSRFGRIKSCEVIRDKKTGDSLQYAFVEFEEEKACEDAYFKMDNVLIDDRRIHVDFSQSVSKIKWHGKGRGVTHFDERGNKRRDAHNEIGRGEYRNGRGKSPRPERQTKPPRSRSDRQARDTSDRSRRNDRMRDYRSPDRRRDRERYSRRTDYVRDSSGRRDRRRSQSEDDRRRKKREYNDAEEARVEKMMSKAKKSKKSKKKKKKRDSSSSSSD